MHPLPANSYVIVDPALLYMPKPDEVNQYEAEAYIKRIRKWSEIVMERQVKLRTSRACVNALRTSSGLKIL